MIDILIADNQPLIRHGLQHAIRCAEGLEVQGEASTARQALLMIDQSPPDLVIASSTIPDGGALEILRSTGRNLRILVLSAHERDAQAIRMMRAGAAGYITKYDDVDRVITAIRRVAKGRTYMSEQVGTAIVNQFSSGDHTPGHARLSTREIEVLSYIAEGYDPAEIADELAISKSTVSTYRTRVLDKLGLQNNVQLTRYALEYGLVD